MASAASQITRYEFASSLQGNEKYLTRGYLKILKLNDFPSDLFHDSIPHCLQSLKLVAPSTT
jgi:hypothetical protein